MKKMLLLAGALAGATALVPAAQAGQGVGACTLDGTASFDKPLTALADVTTGYSFAGDLANCNGSYADKTAKVSAGRPIVIDGVAYRPLDAPSLTGGCKSSTTKGTAFVDWGAGRYSAISYDTTGAAAAVVLKGTFKTGSVTLTAVDPSPGGSYATRTITLVYGGDYTGGPLAFEPPDPTGCNGAGVTTAKIQGVIGHGNYA